MTTASLRAAVAVAVCAVGLAAGCRRGARVDAGNREGVLQIANTLEPSDLDPHTNIDSETDKILNALFEGLVELSGDGHTVLPGVADRWDVSADGLVYTFHLRPDARWSNGEALTSDDFLFSFRRVFDPLVACEASSFGFAIKGSEDYARGRTKDISTLGLDAPSPQTFVIRLAHPAPYFLGVLGVGSPFMPVYRPSLEKFGGVHQRGSPWTRQGNLVCNGPFILRRWTQNQLIEVRKNPLYWDAARVRLAGVDFYPVESAAVQERGFRAGEYHVTTLLPAQKEAAYENARPLVLHISPLLRSSFITFNVSRAPFSDPRVRRALSMAIDRKRLCLAVFHSLAEPAFTQVRPGAGGYAPPSSGAYELHPDAARSLLAEAGFPGGRGFPSIELMVVGSSSETLAVGEVIQAAWREVLGVSANPAPTEEKVYLDAERTKHYEVMVDTWGCTWDDPTAYYQTGQTGNPNNDSGWSDATFDQAYHDAELSPDPRARARAFDIQEARMAAEVPYAPLYYWNKGVLVLPTVRGWPDNSLNHINWKEISLVP